MALAAGIVYLTHRTLKGEVLRLWSERIVTFARPHLHIPQTHFDHDVSKLLFLVRRIGRVADDVLRGYLARHRFDCFIHALGERRGVAAGSKAISVVAVVG